MALNTLQIYRGDPLVINDIITVRQPTLGEIADYGEERYLSTLSALCGTPSDFMVALDDIGIRFEDVSEFQLFIMLTRNLTPDDTSILLGDVDLSKYELQFNSQDGTERLYNRETKSVIDRAIYIQMTNYIRKIHDMRKNMDHGENEETRQYLLDRERRKQARNRRKKFKSILFPLVSALVNCEYYHGSLEDVWNMKVFAFYDSIKRVQKIQGARALLAGIYAGTIDQKKIDTDELNWMGDYK